ncbi:MAG: response regulator [Myxococcota bacterium]
MTFPHLPTVLLVEDSADDVAFARMALGRVGHPHELHVVRDGAEAIDYLRHEDRRARPPAFVLLDLKLPKLDGKAVLRELRGSPWTSRVPTAVLTSSDMPQDVIDAYTLGANSYLRKPVDYEEFVRSATLLVDYWLRLNVPPGHAHAEATGRHLPPAGISGAREGHARVARSSSASPARTPAILVIDAHQDHRQSTIAALREVAGTSPVVALASVEETAEFLQSVVGPPPHIAVDHPRLVLVSPEMPGGDGRDVVQAIRYRLDHHVVVVCFARAPSPALVSECYRLKVNSVVGKPADPAAFQETVHLMGRYWIGLNELPPHPREAVPAVGHPG